MLSTLVVATILFTLAFTAAADSNEGKQYYELREYRLKSAEAAKQVDAYLTGALVPALSRLGVGPVGVLREIEEKAEPIRFVLISYDSLDHIATAAARLAEDEAYQEAAAEYLSTPPEHTPLQRIRSELLVAFDCMPRLIVPELTAQNQDRVFELRTYESPTERLGELKVEMFNAGEVPIFLDCGIIPVFLGQALVGDVTPSLTYMTVYPSMQAKAEAWKKFPVHPDWINLKDVPKYKGTVSKIHKWELVPVEGSQL
jgi:hypothetical protein